VSGTTAHKRNAEYCPAGHPVDPGYTQCEQCRDQQEEDPRICAAIVLALPESYIEKHDLIFARAAATRVWARMAGDIKVSARTFLEDSYDAVWR